MDDEREMTAEEAEQDFKDKMAGIFMEKYKGAHVDEDGFIVVPMPRRTKKDNEDGNKKQ